MKYIFSALLILVGQLGFACPSWNGTYDCKDTFPMTMATNLSGRYPAYDFNGIKVVADGVMRPVGLGSLAQTTCDLNSLTVLMQIPADPNDQCKNGTKVRQTQFVETKTAHGFTSRQINVDVCGDGSKVPVSDLSDDCIAQ